MATGSGRLQTSAEIEPNPLYAAFYADGAQQLRVRVIENVRMARDTFRVRLECPQIASQILPGQFVMVRLDGVNDPLLGRPLALYEVIRTASGAAASIDVVYLVVGKMTRRLATVQAGEEVEVWGPLGNGFPPRPAKHLIMVAGGIGQTPFLALGQRQLGIRQYGNAPQQAALSDRVTLCYGVRNREYLAGLKDFEAAGFDVRISSDDGSIGHQGYVTELLREVLKETQGTERYVVCCGPEPMMHAVAKMCRSAETPCLVSLETPMACGIGICFSCVTKVRQLDGTWDWKRTCVEGPIFDASQIEW